MYRALSKMLILSKRYERNYIYSSNNANGTVTGADGTYVREQACREASSNSEITDEVMRSSTMTASNCRQLCRDSDRDYASLQIVSFSCFRLDFITIVEHSPSCSSKKGFLINFHLAWRFFKINSWLGKYKEHLIKIIVLLSGKF